MKRTFLTAINFLLVLHKSASQTKPEQGYSQLNKHYTKDDHDPKIPPKSTIKPVFFSWWNFHQRSPTTLLLSTCMYLYAMISSKHSFSPSILKKVYDV